MLLRSEEVWLLATPESLRSEWVTTEWGVAWALGKNIVPILLGCTLNALPLRLQVREHFLFEEHEEEIDKFRARLKCDP